MPVYLIIAFCLLADPSTCKDIRPDIADDFPMVGLAMCMQMGERIATEYVETHPKWKLDRVKCRIGSPPQERDARY